MGRMSSGRPTGRPRITAYDALAKPCQQCGKDFSIRDQKLQSLTRFQKRKFCSVKCSNDARRGVYPRSNAFWARVDMGREDACWEWQGHRTLKNYGQVTFAGKKQGAHRAAYMLAKGHIPEGMYVLHSCDNPPCCNPAHLRVGTPKDNVRDCMERGRWFVGGRTFARPLQNRDEILRAEGTTADVARRFGVSKNSVWRIRRSAQS